MKIVESIAALLAALVFTAGCSSTPAPLISKLKTTGEKAALGKTAVPHFRFIDTARGEGPRLADIAAGLLQSEGISSQAVRIPRHVAGSGEAAALAREESADTVVTGEIHELFYGGLTAPSRASLTLTALDAQSGAVLWKLTGVLAKAPSEPSEKYFYVERGRDAPLPMELAREILEAMIAEMRGPAEKQPSAAKKEPAEIGRSKIR